MVWDSISLWEEQLRIAESLVREGTSLADVGLDLHSHIINIKQHLTFLYEQRTYMQIRSEELIPQLIEMPVLTTNKK